MRGGNKVHARGIPNPYGIALCGASSPHGLMFAVGTFDDDGPPLPVNCKNCLKLIAEDDARLRAGIT